MISAAISSSGGHAPRQSSGPNRRLHVPHSGRGMSWIMVLAILVSLVPYALATVAPLQNLAVDREQRDGQGWAALPEQGIERGAAYRRATSEDSEDTTETPKPSRTSARPDGPESTTKSSEHSKTSASRSITTTFSVAVGSQTPSSSKSSSSTTISASPLPSILDSLVYDFTPGPNGEASPCPTFIQSFLADPTFEACYPLSMLFDSSRSFFDAQRSLVGITRTLDATCAANATLCTSYLNQLAQNLTAPENCGTDFELGQSTVVDIYNAMIAYAPIYSTGCLRDPDTGAYCYATAVTNLTNPSAIYIYFLPLNKTLPGTTVPTCGYCLQQTMALYQAATADRRQMVVNTYVSAAKQVNTICGPDFVNETLAAEAIPSSAVDVPVARWLTIAFPLLLGAMMWLA
ncbi:hypothetical protein P885DRAFT_65309 [Corynascus similis CBS 632.67]